MSSRKQFQALDRLFITPLKDSAQSSMIGNSSGVFSSSSKRRKSIFKQPPSSVSHKKTNKIQELPTKQLLEHFQIRNVVSDDFCGCETTLETCQRIIKNYFGNVSILELKNFYQSSPKPKYPISLTSKKLFLSQLPHDYPEIYHSHLINILDHFESQKMTIPSFLLLAWIQFHCKFEYVSFFFDSDLKQCMKYFKFYDKLELALIKYNINFVETLQYFKNLNLEMNSFLQDYQQSVGATLIPVTQYAKFLEIVKIKGPNSVVELIALFISKKESQLYRIIKYWTNNDISNLRGYSRFLNWDLFFEQIKSTN